jgi:RNA polymerase sigma-70 factor (ECF subfamily)
LLSGIGAIEQPASSDVSARAETTLIVAARAGDVRAFEQLYKLHVGRVLGICLRMTHRLDLAEDCAQLTFVRAWRNLGAFEGRSAFSTWLHRIAVNEVLTYTRNHGTRLEAETQGVDDAHLDQEPAEQSTAPPGSVDTGEVMDVERALATLPEGSRHVVVLQAIYGYSHEEVAEMLGIAVGTCKAQLHRGRRMLRERLGLGEFEP